MIVAVSTTHSEKVDVLFETSPTIPAEASAEVKPRPSSNRLTVATSEIMPIDSERFPALSLLGHCGWGQIIRWIMTNGMTVPSCDGSDDELQLWLACNAAAGSLSKNDQIMAEIAESPNVVSVAVSAAIIPCPSSLVGCPVTLMLYHFHNRQVDDSIDLKESGNLASASTSRPSSRGSEITPAPTSSGLIHRLNDLSIHPCPLIGTRVVGLSLLVPQMQQCTPNWQCDMCRTPSDGNARLARHRCANGCDFDLCAECFEKETSPVPGCSIPKGVTVRCSKDHPMEFTSATGTIQGWHCSDCRESFMSVEERMCCYECDEHLCSRCVLTHFTTSEVPKSSRSQVPSFTAAEISAVSSEDCVLAMVGGLARYSVRSIFAEGRGSVVISGVEGDGIAAYNTLFKLSQQLSVGTTNAYQINDSFEAHVLRQLESMTDDEYSSVVADVSKKIREMTASGVDAFDEATAVSIVDEVSLLVRTPRHVPSSAGTLLKVISSLVLESRRLEEKGAELLTKDLLTRTLGLFEVELSNAQLDPDTILSNVSIANTLKLLFDNLTSHLGQLRKTELDLIKQDKLSSHSACLSAIHQARVKLEALKVGRITEPWAIAWRAIDGLFSQVDDRLVFSVDSDAELLKWGGVARQSEGRGSVSTVAVANSDSVTVIPKVVAITGGERPFQVLERASMLVSGATETSDDHFIDLAFTSGNGQSSLDVARSAAQRGAAGALVVVSESKPEDLTIPLHGPPSELLDIRGVRSATPSAGAKAGGISSHIRPDGSLMIRRATATATRKAETKFAFDSNVCRPSVEISPCGLRITRITENYGHSTVRMTPKLGAPINGRGKGLYRVRFHLFTGEEGSKMATRGEGSGAFVGFVGETFTDLNQPLSSLSRGAAVGMESSNSAITGWAFDHPTSTGTAFDSGSVMELEADFVRSLVTFILFLTFLFTFFLCG